jgi:hypothetical protein
MTALHLGHAKLKEAISMTHIKAISYKLIFFSLAIFVVYKISMKKTKKEAS